MHNNENEEAPASDENLRAPRKPVAVARPAGPTFAPREDAIVDLSSEIARTVPCGSDERVTCRRVRGDFYRCNWWSPQTSDAFDNPNMTGLVVTTHRVSKSMFLHVTKTASVLKIDPAPGQSGPPNQSPHNDYSEIRPNKGKENL